MKAFSILEKPGYLALDFGMCLAMNAVQWRHRLKAGGRRDLEHYIEACERMTPDGYYAIPEQEISETEERRLKWKSPIESPFVENNLAHIDLYPCKTGWTAPTVILLHALMSTSDIGYRRWAGRFNELGWNACFMHLPYHYSRVPHGYVNGELAIGADLIRTAEGLRQGVIELRQLMGNLRRRGCRKFGLWASSYGAWIGALLSFMERDFEFLALMEPIVNIEHAIWTGAASISLRMELRRSGIDHALVRRHFHLTSPMHRSPLCGNERVLLSAGDYDRIARYEDVEALRCAWPGSTILRVKQGHFGNRMMPAVFERLREQGRFVVKSF